MNRSILLIVVLCCTAATALIAAEYDLVLRNGDLVDGSGAPARRADVAVTDGRIVVVGAVPGKGKEELDAKGLTIAPGFIDVHTHAEDVDRLPEAENFVRMGVTTLVLGNCGSSVVDVAGLFGRVLSNGVSPNVATLFGHGTVRQRAMGGSFDRPPTAAEMKEMKGLVEKAMRDGSLGLSTGLIYLPGTFAKTDEIIELARVAGEYGGIYASHMRSESSAMMEALDELFRIAQEGKIRAHVSHIKLSGRSNWGRTNKVLAALEKAREQGLIITQDQYAYTASSTSISTLIPKSYREGGRFKEHYRDPATRRRMIEIMRAPRERSGSEDYSYAVIAQFKRNKALNGLNIKQAARVLRGADDLEAQIETILEIHDKGGASAVFHGMNEYDLQAFMRHTNTMFASDSGVRRFGEGVPHPRGYGNNARILERYVGELGVLQLEEAVRRMTSLPAATFRIEHRGLVREGWWADLVVFDARGVRENTKFAAPHSYAKGFKRVYVNGVAVVKSDRHTGARPGRPVRLPSSSGMVQAAK